MKERNVICILKYYINFIVGSKNEILLQLRRNHLIYYNKVM